jgi:hypothetical protein
MRRKELNSSKEDGNPSTVVIAEDEAQELLYDMEPSLMDDHESSSDEKNASSNVNMGKDGESESGQGDIYPECMSQADAGVSSLPPALVTPLSDFTDAASSPSYDKKLRGTALSGFSCIDVFAGIGMLCWAFVALGATMGGFVEMDLLCSELLQERHPKALAAGNFYATEWQEWPDTNIVCAGWEVPRFHQRAIRLAQKIGVHRKQQIWPD